MSTPQTSFMKGWLPAFLWLALIFGLSSIPRSDLPRITVFEISALVHAFEYSVLGGLLLRGFRSSLPGTNIFLPALLTAVAAILFGAADEWHQSFVPGRCCDPADLCVDAFAAVLGILLCVRKTEMSASKVRAAAV